MSNRKDWDKLIADMKAELLATEDEDEIGQILQHYQRKIKTELIWCGLSLIYKFILNIPARVPRI